MLGPYKEAARRLHEIAQSQQGFFTTKQAPRSGFAEKTHSYHVNAGNWIREHAGSTASPIFRLRFLARIFSKGPKAAYPWLLKGRLRHGVAHAFRADDQGHRHDAARWHASLKKMRKSGVNRCVPCSRQRRQRPLTTISNSSSGKQGRIWTARRKA